MKVIGKCEYTDLNIHSKSRWLDLELIKNYSVSFYLVGTNVLHVIPSGLPTQRGVEKLLEKREEFLREAGLWEKDHYELKSYSHIKTIPPKDSRTLFTNFLIKENNRGFLKGFWGYNVSSPLRWIFNIGYRLHTPHFSIIMVKDYKTAIDDVLSMQKKQEGPEETNQVIYTQKDVDQYIDDLLTFMESTTWFETDLEIKSVDESHPFKVLYDVISILKMDFNSVLKQERDNTALLEKSREKYRILTDNLRDLVFTTDRNFELISAAGDSVNTLGYTMEELWTLKKAGGELIIHPSSFELVKEKAREVMETKKSLSFEARMIHKREEHCWIACTLSPLLEDNGEMSGIHGLLHNITGQKENEEKLAAIRHQLMEVALQAGKTQLATGLLHDIANILNGVNIALDTLEALNENSEVKNLLQAHALLASQEGNYSEFFTNDPKGKILPVYFQRLGKSLEQERDKSSQEVEALKNKVKAIREIISTQQKYARTSAPEEAVNLAGVLEDATVLQGNFLKKFEVILQKKYEQNLELLVRGNKAKLIHVMINLIKNAVEAMKDNPPEKRILTIEMAPRDSNTALILVIDEGMGIPEENLEVIFKYGVTMKKGGHGFGLNICENYITEMKGKIYARNWEKGAMFCIEIPLSAGDRK